MILSLILNLLHTLHKNAESKIKRLHLDQGRSRHARQIISHRASDLHRDDLADLRVPFNEDHTVDLRRVAVRSTNGNPSVAPFHQYIQRLAHVRLIDLQGNPLLQFHQTLITRLLDISWNRVPQRLAGCTWLEGELERPDTVKTDLLHKIHQRLKFLFRFARIPNDKSCADGEVRDGGAHLA